METAPFPIVPELLAEAIELPLASWPGNCHAVATRIRDMVPVKGMRLARGHWLGEVDRDSVYHCAPVQHSWLLLGDGRVLDPTRWAITDPRRPAIHIGPCDHYDEGGRLIAARMPPPLPGAADGATRFVSRLDDGQRRELASILRDGGRADGEAGAPMAVNRLAGLLRDALKDDPDRVANVQALYRFAAANGFKAAIPIDSWRRVIEPESLFCRQGSNRWFAPPAAEQLGDTAILSRLLDHFLSLESRPSLEADLEDLGYDIETDFYPSLDRLRDMSDMPVDLLPRSLCDTLAVVAGDLLGSGFGEHLRVERYAASLGVSRRGLNDLLGAFGERGGYSLEWDCGDEPDTAAPVGTSTETTGFSMEM